MPFRNSCHLPFPPKLISPFTLQFSIVLFVIQYQISNSNYLCKNAFNTNFLLYLKKAGLTRRNIVLSTKLYVVAAPACALIVTGADYELFSRCKQLTLNKK